MLLLISQKHNGQYGAADKKGLSNYNIKIKMKVSNGSLWLGREWKEAIKLSLETADCGVEPIYSYKHPDKLLDNEQIITGYQIYGWGNGYGRKYHTRIPKSLNNFVAEILKSDN